MIQYALMTRETHTLKFADPLTELIARGQKYATWRLNNDKDLQSGDGLNLVHHSSARLFAAGSITDVTERTFVTLRPEDFSGHEPFDSEETMLATYSRYYDQPVERVTPLTVVHFTLHLVCNRPGSDETDVFIWRNTA
jgi:hypothetical protein